MSLTSEPIILDSLTNSGVPEHLHYGLMLYITQRISPGGFMTAVLSNDLREAFGRADEESRAGMFELVKWLYNKAPSNIWGTPERVEAWLSGES